MIKRAACGRADNLATLSASRSRTYKREPSRARDVAVCVAALILATISFPARATSASAQGDTTQRREQPAAETVYEAKATTFGCNSISTLSDLSRIRSDKGAFDQTLFQQMVYGECIAIAQGQVVDGSPVEGNASVLRVGAKATPPGFMAPSDDFQIKPADARH